MRSLLGFEALRDRTPLPRHERGLGPGAGPLRWLERHPQAIVLDRVQLPDRLRPAIQKLMRRWFDAVSRLGLPRGHVLRPRFPHHPLPWRGRSDREALRLQAESTTEGHSWPSWRRTPRPASSAMPTENCARTSRTTRSSASSDSGRNVPGGIPEELIFDSKLTTYANLNELNRLGIQFITLRRRSPGLLRGDRPDAAVGMAPDRVEGRLATVQDSANTRSTDRSVRLRRSGASSDHHRPGSRGTDGPR